MADNSILSLAVGTGITVATDDIASVHYPRGKLSLGADGIAVDAGAGAGVVGTDTQRVTLGSDDPAVVALQLIDNAVSGAGFNVTQLGGVAVAMGTGARSAGTQRVTIATDDAVPVTGTFYQATQPVSGTVTANAGSGTFTVSGAVTLAAGATSIGKAEDVASADADVGVPSMAVRKATPANTSGLDGDYEFLQMSAGRLWVSAAVDTALPTGTNTIGAVNIAAAQTLGTVTTVSTVTNLSQLGGAAVPIGAGLEATAVRVTLPTNGTGVIAGVTTVTTVTTVGAVTAITNALPAGTNAIGKLAANSGVDIGDVDVTSIAAGANLIGDVSLQPRTTGGLTMHKTTSAATTNATSVKGSAGQVYNIQCFNVNAAVRYLKLYNKATAPTVGTDVPVKTLAIPGNTAGSGFVIAWPQGVAFDTGIAFALTTEATDAGTTGVALSEITVNIDYK